MAQTITIRLSKELADWLQAEAAKEGVSQTAIVTAQLKRARNGNGVRKYMRLAGTVSGPKNLSSRQGFASE